MDTRRINVGGDLRPQAGTRYNRQLAKKPLPTFVSDYEWAYYEQCLNTQNFDFCLNFRQLFGLKIQEEWHE
jgi:hypothetical protein